MLICFGHTKKEIERIEHPDLLIREINDFINQQPDLFRRVEIDGHEAVEWEREIREKHASISSIEVVLVLPETMMYDVLVSTAEYLDGAIPLLEPLANDFYKEPDSEAWTKLSQLFESVQWIIHSIQTMDHMNTQKPIISDQTWQPYLAEAYRIREILDDFSGAMEVQDAVLIGDLLSYEIKPIFETMSQSIPAILPEIPNEVRRDETH
ncbi:hypothetical protein [Anoxynatronum buryatiense]|uniref:Uncharacterized protein n=1 Tax=Anoxynatronum buryatiense TaxID=489973 RepID=A0AA46AIS9_9CLOT|nr:hypothetical protein [Anoxynatronum buryatiense]SMP52514.1 hypothetical protein SAMN06296020_104250 [Anoxynatronum buryatiense]